MTPRQKEVAIQNLSPRARELYDRVLKGKWYKAYDATIPKAMTELTSAGLVTVAGRVKVIEACFVPTGTVGLRLEQYPKARS
jgi:hypothetical protein